MASIINTVTLSDHIRAAIRSSGLTRYRIAQEADVAESVLSRFMSGESGLSTGTLDRIAKVLRLRIVMDGPRKSILKKRRR